MVIGYTTFIRHSSPVMNLARSTAINVMQITFTGKNGVSVKMFEFSVTSGRILAQYPVLFYEWNQYLKTAVDIECI